MKKIDKQIEEYLFDTNFRWMAIKTKIVNRLPLASWEYEEYNRIREKTISLLSSYRSELIKEIEDGIYSDGVTRLKCGCEVMKVTLCDKHAGFIKVDVITKIKKENV